MRCFISSLVPSPPPELDDDFEDGPFEGIEILNLLLLCDRLIRSRELSSFGVFR
jgi:hypothetical protein